MRSTVMLQFHLQLQPLHLCPCNVKAGAVKMMDILANIETMFANVKPDHRTVGITLSMDEVASDAAAVWLQSMHTTRGDHILSYTSTTHMVNLLADLATQCQFSIPTSHLRPSPCQFSNSSGLQYSVTTMMSSLDSVVISVYFFACVTYIVKSHS
jgi:hypothetical protein